MIPAIPAPLPMPFAQNGERRTIPENNTVPGSADASWALGFPPVTRINKQAGGKPPYGLDFQGIFFTICQHLFFSQSGNLFPWVGESGDQPGLNYLKGAMVLGSDGETYIALKPSGPDVPNSEGTGFVGPVDPVGDTTGHWISMQALFSINPWDIFPLRVPIAVDGVRFGGSDGRRAIMPGETTARENWVACDGGTDDKGGTVPDLRGRMILGASSSYPAGSTGGSATHSHSLSGTVGATTLSISQMPAHDHSVANSGSINYGNGPYINYHYNGNNTKSDKTGGSNTHTHSLDASSGDANNLPPYYSLSYIMRIA